MWSEGLDPSESVCYHKDLQHYHYLDISGDVASGMASICMIHIGIGDVSWIPGVGLTWTYSGKVSAARDYAHTHSNHVYAPSVSITQDQWSAKNVSAPTVTMLHGNQYIAGMCVKVYRSWCAQLRHELELYFVGRVISQMDMALLGRVDNTPDAVCAGVVHTTFNLPFNAIRAAFALPRTRPPVETVAVLTLMLVFAVAGAAPYLKLVITEASYGAYSPIAYSLLAHLVLSQA